MSRPPERAQALGLPVWNARATWLVTAAVLLIYAFTQYRDLSTWDSALIALVARPGWDRPPARLPPAHLAGVPGQRACRVFRPRSRWACCRWSRAPCCVSRWPAWPGPAGRARDPGGRRLRTHVAAMLGADGRLPRWVWRCTRSGGIPPPGSRSIAWRPSWRSGRWRTCWRRCSPLRRPRAGSRRRPCSLPDLGFGLAASVHPVVSTLVAPGGAALVVILALVHRRLGGRALAGGVLGGIAGLVPYLGIPLLARRQDVFIWGDPARRRPALWRFLRGAGLCPATSGAPAAQLVDHMLDWLGWAAAIGRPVAAGARLRGLGDAGAAAAAGGAGRADGRRCWPCWPSPPMSSGIRENPDYLGYTAGPFAVCAAGGWRWWHRLGRGSVAARGLAGGHRRRGAGGGGLLTPPALFARTRAHGYALPGCWRPARWPRPPRAAS